MHPGLMYEAGRGKEMHPGGEVISRDGTPPLRVLITALGMDNRQLRHKKKGNNGQRAFRSQDLHIAEIMFYALPTTMSSPAQLYVPQLGALRL